MDKDNIVFCNRFDRPTLEQIEKEMKNENLDDHSTSMTEEDFFDYIQKNRKIIPNQQRLADKKKFIWAVRELSETYKIDADLKSSDDGYTAHLYMNFASYSGYIKKLLGLIFMLADEFSMFEANENNDSDILLCFTYHTHNVYLKEKEMTDFS